MIGALQYLTITRLDLTCVVNFVSQYMQSLIVDFFTILMAHSTMGYIYLFLHLQVFLPTIKLIKLVALTPAAPFWLCNLFW
jgi:hypothetical protein